MLELTNLYFFQRCDGSCPDNTQVTIPFIAGDGIGPEIMAAAQAIINHAVHAAYGDAKSLVWCGSTRGQVRF